MSLGGGFVAQGHQASKQNREMLHSNKRRPFEKQHRIGLADHGNLPNDPRSAEMRSFLRIHLNAKRKREKLTAHLIFALTFLVFGIIIYYLAN